MRASWFIAGGTGVVAASALLACAVSGSHGEPAPLPDSGDAESVVPESGTTEADARHDVATPSCSEAGWCVTALPDVDLIMKDIWPLAGRAFAIAESPTLGVKVLEWSDASAKWTYIDDGTQNEPGLGKYAGKIWAPGEDELYYAVSPGFIYHAARPAPPKATWTWTRRRLEDHSQTASADPEAGHPTYWQTYTQYPALGVWGTGSGDVYAWFTNTIYHRTSVDGGEPEWVAEYVADDADVPTERMFFLGAAGTGPGDLWFSGARSRAGAGCVVVVRKTAAGYTRIADGVLPGIYRACTPRTGFLSIGGTQGWLMDIQSPAADQLIGLKGARDGLRITASGGSYTVDVASVPQTVASRALNSAWSTPENLWLSGWGLVVVGNDVWDGGAYKLSSISLSGGPLDRPMYQIRGTSNTNLWAIGVRYALHKTTP